MEFRYNPSLSFIKEYRGNPFADNQYFFGASPEAIPRSKLFRWMLTPNPKREEKRKDHWRPDVIEDSNFMNSTHDMIVWLGHASFFIQVDGIKILTDPVFFDLAPVLKRRHKLPVSTSFFKDIQYIILSHGHRDHLDIPSLKVLAKQNPNCEILCPLGFTSILRECGFTKIQEAAWWQQYKTIPQLKIHFLPAKHWNRRFITDYNTTLWGSHWIETSCKKIYFAGDTALADHFTEIHQTLGAPDYCLMPVGAYLPRFVMEWAHIAPWEAVDAFHTMNAKHFIPMHFGTFDLSDEPASEPYRLLQQYEKEGKFKDTKLHLPAVGEIIAL